MRAILGSVAALAMVTAASAADLPVKSPPPAPVMAPVWNWTGFYVGVNAGYGWGRSTWDLPAVTVSSKGWLAGATLGYNYQS